MITHRLTNYWTLFELAVADFNCFELVSGYRYRLCNSEQLASLNNGTVANLIFQNSLQSKLPKPTPSLISLN